MAIVQHPTSPGTPLASPPVADNSPPAPDAGIADVPATGGATVMTGAMA